MRPDTHSKWSISVLGVFKRLSDIVPVFPWIRVCVLAVALPLGVHAELQDVVYLKNGSIVRGQIVEQDPASSLKIQTADQNVFVFRMDEVTKIVKEENPNSSSQGYAIVSSGTALAPVVSGGPEEMTSLPGSVRQVIGSTMSWVGFPMFVLGGALTAVAINEGNASLTESMIGTAGIGLIAWVAGIPINGSGASAMVHSVNGLSRSESVDMSGWGTYGLSWATMGLGTAVGAGGLIYANSSEGGSKKGGLVVFGAGCVGVLTGLVLQFVAWHQFGNSAERANTQFYSLKHVSLGPTFSPDVRGHLEPRLTLNLGGEF